MNSPGGGMGAFPNGATAPGAAAGFWYHTDSWRAIASTYSFIDSPFAFFQPWWRVCYGRIHAKF